MESQPPPNAVRGRLQFTIRSLLLLTTAIAVLCALVLWQGVYGGIAFGLLAGGIVVFMGFRRRSRSLGLAGTTLIGLSLLGLGIVHWIGPRFSDHVVFLDMAAVDAETGQSLSPKTLDVVWKNGEGGGVSHWPAASHEIVPIAFFAEYFPRRSQYFTLLPDYHVRVTADGYEHFDKKLSDLIGQETWPLDKPFPVVTIKLKKKASGSKSVGREVK